MSISPTFPPPLWILSPGIPPFQHLPSIVSEKIPNTATMPGLTNIEVPIEAPKCINGNNNSSSQALNIIIPIGGIGSRFSKVGYRYPKPLINIIGRPMILRLIDNLSLRPEDTLWMAANIEIDDEFRIGQLVLKTFPQVDFRLLRLKHQTKGASETVSLLSTSKNWV
tara:strand:+ start:834 stop:1334 length:501 start_codon:yes stop_codon:yes gene_type:complete